MATLAQVEQRIFEREGFRVKLLPFKENEKRYPAYDYPVMGSNKWRLSEWKEARLAPYMTQIRAATVYKGDGTVVRADIKLGPLRDSYFEALYGAVVPPPLPAGARANVLEFKTPDAAGRAPRGFKRQ